jgi:FlaA1/EpsC-like NDP-sugar epimerase
MVKLPTSVSMQHMVTDFEPELLHTFQLSRSIKFLAILDGIFAIYALYFSNWLPIMFLGAIAGYHGATRFNKSSTLLYIVCQVCAMLARIGFVVYYCVNNETWPANLLVWTSLVVLLELYIIRFVTIFYKRIRNLEPDQLEQLTCGPLVAVNVVYW